MRVFKRCHIKFYKIVALMFVLYSCKKPAEIPHPPARKTAIFPYFPCYPKSYWIYKDSLGNFSNVKVDDDYYEYSIKTNDDSINEPFLLPKIGDDLYFYGKKIIRVSGKLYYYYPHSEYDIFEPVYIENNFEDFNTIILNQSIQTLSFVETLDSIIVNGNLYDTVIVNKVIFYAENKPDPILRYFSKNIGLILEQVIYNQDSIPDTVNVKSITSYQIFKE